MKIKIAVTGGSGFIGKEILLELLRNNFHALSFQRKAENNAEVDIRYFDLSNIDDRTIKILSDVDTVIHAAALVHKGDSNYSDQVCLNFKSTKKLFEVCEKAKVTKFIFLSTVAVYGLISSKEKIDIKKNVSPKSSYGKAKLMSEMYLLNKKSKIKVSVIRLPLVYGKNAPGNYGMLEKIANLNLPLPFLHIKNKRSMVSVKRVAEIIVKGVIHKDKFIGLNLLAESKPFSTEDILKKIMTNNNNSSTLFYFPPFVIRILLSLIGKSKIYEQLYKDLEFVSTISEE